MNRLPNSYLLTNKLGLLTSLQHYHQVSRMLSVSHYVRMTLDFLPETYRVSNPTDRRTFLEKFTRKHASPFIHL